MPRVHNQTLEATTRPPAVLVDNVSFAWSPRSKIESIQLQLQSGQMLGLLGPNGAGKTTLISLIAGLIRPSEGKITVCGLDSATQAPQARQKLGFVFQSISLDRFLTVGQNLHYAGGLQGLGKAAIERRIEALNAEFGLAPLLKRPAGSLSGGQKRLCDIARALIGSPEVLILDEPTTALDPVAKEQVWGSLKRLQAQGLSILIATHLMDEAADCNEVCFLSQGKIHWSGTPEAALSQLPDQSLTTVRKASLTDWFIWTMGQSNRSLKGKADTTNAANRVSP